MPASQPSDPSPSDGPQAVLKENGIESCFIGKLQGLKYEYRPDITDRASLERNFRAKFEELNRVRLTDADCPARQRPPTTRSHPAESERSDGQFARLLDEIVEYNNDPGNGYTKTLLCFLQLFIVSEHKLMIMRPYQVYAVQHMVKCIDDDNGNGFVWHTTGRSLPFGNNAPCLVSVKRMAKN